MRYLLPLAPLLCLLAAYAASRVPLSRYVSGLLLAFALMGTKDVLVPFILTDPRDQALPLIAQRSNRILLENNPWFFTPPFQPQGLNQPVEGTTVIKSPQTEFRPGDIFVQSEFEYRETQRLNGSQPVHSWLTNNAQIQGNSFKNSIPLALPGRDFAPHDYLYTNPQTWVFSSR